MRMSPRLRRLGGSTSRACSTQGTLARDCSVRGRRGRSAWLTWVSQRRRAGAGSHRAIQRRVCCSQVLRRVRGTGCSPQWPIRYGDGGASRIVVYPTHHVAHGSPTSRLLLLLLMSHAVVAVEIYPPGAACLPLRSGALDGAWVCFVLFSNFWLPHPYLLRGPQVGGNAP